LPSPEQRRLEKYSSLLYSSSVGLSKFWN